nr:MAG: putative capsid protein precursor [Sichuan forest noda-like virus 4]
MVRRRLNRRSNNRTRRSRASNPIQVLAPAGPGQQRTGRPPPRPRRRRMGMNIPRGVQSRLSEAGLAFLKCAFASPDFSVDPGKGIPDQFHGRTLGLKDCVTTALTFTPGTDTYILAAPVPGYAYFVTEVPIGTPVAGLTGVTFPTFETNFGTGADAVNKFTKFRYASLAVGLYPTSNLMQFAGSIQVWRTDLNLAENARNAVVDVGPPVAVEQFVTKRIQGLQSITTLAPRDNYSESFIKGGYTFAFDKSQDFTWEDFVSAVRYDQDSAPVITRRSLVFDGTHFLTGMGNVNSIIIKVSTPVGAVNSAMLRVWNCMELQPNTDSSLFQFSGVSPHHDPLAIEMYHQLKMRFPVAMPCSENAKFWETVLRVMQQISRVGMLLPGPAGVISGGLSTMVDSIAGLVI